MSLFDNDGNRNQYLPFIKEESTRSEMEILAWCLMTNHVHFVAVPHRETSLARGFGEAHKRYTRMKNFKDNVRGYLFQGRFGSCVLDERLMEMEDIENVRRSTKTGRPAGAADFLKAIEKLTGRMLERKKPGPKGKKGLN